MAAMGFAARLAIRRAEMLSPCRADAQPWVLWCWPRTFASEFGRPSAAGFAHLGFDPSHLVIVETARSCEVLNAIEEGLKAASAAVVLGVLEQVELTSARRLSLAAGETGTPCLIVTHPASESAAATATRWRVAHAPGAAHPFDARAPGPVRFAVSLERCRAQPARARESPLLLEWCDETCRFCLASIVADLPAQTCGTGGGAPAAAVRAR